MTAASLILSMIQQLSIYLMPILVGCGLMVRWMRRLDG